MNSSYLKILSEKEKQEMEKKLDEQFGIKKIEGIISMRGQERLFLFQGNFTEKQICELENSVPIERVGIYFAKIVADKLKLSIEGTHIFKDEITKNIFEIQTRDDLENWMKGNELNIETGKKDFLVMKYKNDFLGCGKASEKKITNFIPKNRRLKEKS